MCKQKLQDVVVQNKTVLCPYCGRTCENFVGHAIVKVVKIKSHTMRRRVTQVECRISNWPGKIKNRHAGRSCCCRGVACDAR